jgi:very-short-patch-repair endonuclease
VVEADGGQHAGDTNDETRTAWLKTQDWTVIRFWNNEILSNLDGVLETILRALNDASRHGHDVEDPHPPTRTRVPPSPASRARG